MKCFRRLVALLGILLLLPSGGMVAEIALPTEMTSAFSEDRWLDFELVALCELFESDSKCLTVMQKDGLNTICILEKIGGTWRIVAENANIMRPGPLKTDNPNIGSGSYSFWVSYASPRLEGFSGWAESYNFETTPQGEYSLVRYTFHDEAANLQLSIHAESERFWIRVQNLEEIQEAYVATVPATSISEIDPDALNAFIYEAVK